MITPEAFATSIPETFAATNRSASTLNNQGPSLLFYIAAPA